MKPALVGRKEKEGRVFALRIPRAEFHPKEKMRTALLGLTVVTAFLILNRAICLGEMEN